jgi:V/A-type H+-transporting ATPase subunit I
MIARMERVELLYLRSEQSAMVDFLQRNGVLHLEEVPLALEAHPGFLHRAHLSADDRAELAALRETEIYLKEALPLLTHTPAHAELVAAGPVVEKEDAARRAKHIRLWHRQLRSLHRRRFNLDDNMAALRGYEAMLMAIAPLLSVRQVVLGETARAVVLQGFSEDGINALQQHVIKSAGGSIEFLRQAVKDGVALVIVHPAGKGEAVAAALREEGLHVLSSPDGDVGGKSVREVIAAVQGKLARLEAERAQLTQDLSDLSVRIAAPLQATSQLVNTRIAQLEVTSSFAQSKLIGVVHGWVPGDAMEGLCRNLKAEFGARVALGTLSKSDVDIHRIPTKLQNKPAFRPFEIMLSIMRPAVYGSFDPTALVACAFTFFYGFIVGDMGYALVMFAIAYFAQKKFGHIKVVSDALHILRFMAASTFVFGFIYLEFFGSVLEKLTGWHAIFHRGHEINTLLAIAVLVGFIHVPMALIIGIREGYAHNHTKHAEEKLGMLLGLAALIIAVVSSQGYFPLGGTVGYASAGLIFAASLYLLFKSMGGMFLAGVIEIIGLTANIFSYARLMALGVAGIALAEVANGIAASQSGIMWLLLGVPGAMLVHAFNILISVFSPTIHSLRLNLVEFLPKFYESGGRHYEPFRKDLAW